MWVALCPGSKIGFKNRVVNVDHQQLTVDVLIWKFRSIDILQTSLLRAQSICTDSTNQDSLTAWDTYPEQSNHEEAFRIRSILTTFLRHDRFLSHISNQNDNSQRRYLVSQHVLRDTFNRASKCLWPAFQSSSLVCGIVDSIYGSAQK